MTISRKMEQNFEDQYTLEGIVWDSREVRILCEEDRFFRFERTKVYALYVHESTKEREVWEETDIKRKEGIGRESILLP